MNHDYAITFACYNSVNYTKACVDSLVNAGTPMDRVVVVDNGSTDETREYLMGIDFGGRIYNKVNQGCGVAWNQGILHFQAEWTVIMNNDLIVSLNWIDNLIQTAIDNNLTVISPAMVEGELDYDFNRFAPESSIKMNRVLRRQTQHAVCLCVHRSVFQEIGYFRATPKLLGFEDTIFFNDLRKSDLRAATAGSVWLHHFGSVTQKEMKRELGKSEKDNLLDVNDRYLLQQGWVERKLLKFNSKRRISAWRKEEMAAYGMTLRGERVNGEFIWN